MIPRPFFTVILAVVAFAGAIAIAAGCGTERLVAPVLDPDITSAVDSDLALRAYLPADDPVNVVANLEAAYRNRDIDAYAALFAPEFVYKFQPQDACATGRESWGLEDELASTGRMFYSSKMKRIQIRLKKQPAVPATEPGLGHTMYVEVTHTFLRVEHRDGQVFQVNGDRQEFFLRRAYDDDGRERWLIVEWRDLPGGA